MSNDNGRYVLCIASSRPSSHLTQAGGGGAINLICPHTGSIISTLRVGDGQGKSVMGISSLSTFPVLFGTQGIPPMMAYSSNLSRKDDTYAMLLTIRNSSSHPVINWKCRLPEPRLSAGVLVSPCGHFIIGGSSTGNIFVWSAFGGNLLNTIKAHYRGVMKMTWSDCNSYLITGGEDGMVHTFSLLDLVEQHQDIDYRPVTPVRTWSIHHLAVSSLLGLTGSRAVSAAEDGQIAIMEIFSGNTIAKLQISEATEALSFHNGCLFVGSQSGVIYTFDLDVYAAHQTSRRGLVVKRRKVSKLTSVEDKAFESLENGDSFKNELRGHERSITALTVLNEDPSSNLLISGDESGSIRVWDLESRGCIRVINPWSHSVQNGLVPKDKAGSVLHPITNIIILPISNKIKSGSDTEFGGEGSNDKESKSNSIISLLTPLKKFSENLSDGNPKKKWVAVPFIKPKLTKDSMIYIQPTKLTRRGNDYQ